MECSLKSIHTTELIVEKAVYKVKQGTLDVEKEIVLALALETEIHGMLRY